LVKSSIENEEKIEEEKTTEEEKKSEEKSGDKKFSYKDLSQIDEQSKESSTPIRNSVKRDVTLHKQITPFDFVNIDERFNCGKVSLADDSS